MASCRLPRCSLRKVGPQTQHQRLIEALAAQKKRASLIMQGDFHATAAGRITRSAELSLPRPVDIVTSGALGTGDMAFPSAFRTVESKPSQLVGMDEALKPTEKNGFSIIDVTPDKMTFTLLMWRPPQAVEEIDTMKRALVSRYHADEASTSRNVRSPVRTYRAAPGTADRRTAPSWPPGDRLFGVGAFNARGLRR